MWVLIMQSEDDHILVSLHLNQEQAQESLLDYVSQHWNTTWFGELPNFLKLSDAHSYMRLTGDRYAISPIRIGGDRISTRTTNFNYFQEAENGNLGVGD